MIGGLLDDCSRGCLHRLRPTRRGVRYRGQNKLLGRLTLRGPDEFPDGLLVDTQALRNRSVAQPLALEFFDAPQPLPTHTPSTTTPTHFSSQPHHAVLRITLLVPAYRALRLPERPRYFGLLRETRVDQQHDRIDFGHRIISAKVMYRQSSHYDHALIFLHTPRAARIDDHRVRRGCRGQHQGQLGVHGQTAKADRFGSAT